MTELFAYQKKGVRKIRHFRGRALLADEMGLGKTIQALQWCREEDAWPCVVICPASLKRNWEREARIHLNMMGEVLSGRDPMKSRLPRSPKLLIINYDIADGWRTWLSDFSPRTLILDECHYIKNPGAKRTKAVKAISQGVPNVIAVSGTPLTNRPAELFPALNILLPDVFRYFRPFAERYCNLRRTPWGWDYSGAKNLPELHGTLKKKVMIRRKKADVLTDLPPKRRMTVALDIENRTEYEMAQENFLGWLSTISLQKSKKASNAESIAEMGYLKRLAAQGKIQNVIEWVDDFLQESDGKLVLYAIHKIVISEIHKRFKKTSVVLTGDTPAKKRMMAVDAFQKNKDIRLFIGNIQAAGTGISLTSASSLAFAEMGWTPGEHTQAEDRIHRIGQKNFADIYYLVAENTIEEELCELIQKKFSVLDQTLDGGEGTDFDILSQLRSMMKGKINAEA